MKGVVELALMLVCVCLCSVFALGCSSDRDDGGRVLLEIISISNVSLAKQRGYPSTLGVVVGKQKDGSSIAVAIPAIKDRVVLEAYSKLKRGQRIQLNPIPWSKRPSKIDAIYLANDFFDQHELKLFFDLQQ